MVKAAFSSPIFGTSYNDPGWQVQPTLFMSALGRRRVGTSWKRWFRTSVAGKCPSTAGTTTIVRDLYRYKVSRLGTCGT